MKRPAYMLIGLGEAVAEFGAVIEDVGFWLLKRVQK